jgi:hypothetical protein
VTRDRDFIKRTKILKPYFEILQSFEAVQRTKMSVKPHVTPAQVGPTLRLEVSFTQQDQGGIISTQCKRLSIPSRQPTHPNPHLSNALYSYTNMRRSLIRMSTKVGKTQESNENIQLITFLRLEVRTSGCRIVLRQLCGRGLYFADSDRFIRPWIYPEGWVDPFIGQLDLH